jgi:hypothetical protein
MENTLRLIITGVVPIVGMTLVFSSLLQLHKKRWFPQFMGVYAILTAFGQVFFITKPADPYLVFNMIVWVIISTAIVIFVKFVEPASW